MSEQRRLPELPVLGAVSAAPISPSSLPSSRTAREKYGVLFWLGSAGLMGVILWVGWFAWNVWSMRDVWRDVFVLFDERSALVERIQAGDRLANDPRVTPAQIWEFVFRKELPTLARWRLAERLGAEAVRGDPRGFALATARSPNWPDWLRAQFARALAEAAVQGVTLSEVGLEEMTDHPDPVTRAFTLVALATRRGADATAQANARDQLHRLAADQPFLTRFVDCLRIVLEQPDRDRRLQALEDAKLWMRRGHPDFASIWEGWNMGVSGLEPINEPVGRSSSNLKGESPSRERLRRSRTRMGDDHALTHLVGGWENDHDARSDGIGLKWVGLVSIRQVCRTDQPESNAIVSCR